jgi:putative endonuclease
MATVSNHTSVRAVLGQQAENVIAQWLTKQGYTILAQNYKKRSGEVDVIARKDEVIAFVEVKFRSTNYFHLSQVITLTKQHRIARAARHFLLDKPCQNTVYRFDVALLERHQDEVRVTYIPNAFVPAYDYSY